MILAGASFYFIGHDEVVLSFIALGYSPAIIYPLAVAKILGIIAITTKKSKILKNLAYLGFATNLTLAVIAHLSVGDGEQGGALMGLALLVGSIFFEWRMNTSKELALATK